MPPIFCVVSLGRGRGKTRLIERLASELSRAGIKVATIKHSEGHVDLVDKDSHKHLEAGAIEVSIVSSSELITIRRTQASLDDAVDSLRLKADLILVEGFKGSPHPKILCAEDEREAEEALKIISNVRAIILKSPGSTEEIAGIRIMGYDEALELIKRGVVEYWVKQVPGLNCGKCRYGSCQELAEAIRRGEASIRDCVARNTFKAKITVNGEEIPLGTWPQHLLREIVKAFVLSLKLSEDTLKNARRIVIEVGLED